MIHICLFFVCNASNSIGKSGNNALW